MSPRQTETLTLPASAPGTARFLRLHRYGAGHPRKVYVQASLHADETPAQLVALHLLEQLDALASAGRIQSEIVVVPAANPIGLDQHGRTGLQGRFHNRTGQNFNRGWPALGKRVGDLSDRLGPDPDQNVRVIRAAFQRAVAALPAYTDEEALRKHLITEACTAELVFDLHCDDVALPYLYVSPHNWPDLADFAAYFGAEAVLVAEDSGGGSFDEAFTLPWVHLARAHPHHPVPVATASMTVELRGSRDVSDAQAATDAAAIVSTLARRGMVDVPAGAPPPLGCTATPTVACAYVRARRCGLVVYPVALGQRVSRGEPVAVVIDPLADDLAQARRVHRAPTSGRVLSLRGPRAVTTGQILVKIVGTQKIDDHPLLED